ncbi:MAG: hypothetical protein ACK5Q5_21550 [Planctomycetaceae bacterium]
MHDHARRELWKGTTAGGWARYYISTNDDLILQVNRRQVHDSADVLRSTLQGWNVLKIYDMSQGTVGDYWVDL